MDAACARCISHRTKRWQRTAKSCGPGAATLALRWWVFLPATGARKAASPGRARISRKTIARGKPGCLGCTCGLTRVHFCSTLRTRDCGRSRRPAFPAPSAVQRDNEMQRPGRKPAAGMRALILIAGSSSLLFEIRIRRLHRHCEERSDDPSPLAPQTTQGRESAEARRAKAEAIHIATS
jgi:hypothetical protein